MDRPSVTVTPLLRIVIKDPAGQPGQGLVSKFGEWCFSEGVLAVYTPELSTQCLIGFFDPRHKEKIESWFAEHKIDIDATA